MAGETGKEIPYIIALDFDGTLVEDKFPKIGKPNLAIFSAAFYWRAIGYKVILWTCRHGKALDEAVAFCRSLGLTFDAVNCNIPEVQEKYDTDTRKIYANVYIDDKNLTPQEPSKDRWYDPKELFRAWR